MSSLARLAILAAAALACVATSAPNEPVPEPDVCSAAPGAATIDSLELGRADVAGDFVPLADGDFVDVVYGGQGLAMLPVRVRAHGAALPSCLAQSTEVVDDNTALVIGSETRPIATDDLGDGTRATDAIYVIVGYLDAEQTPVTVTTSAGGATVTRHLTLQVN